MLKSLKLTVKFKLRFYETFYTGCIIPMQYLTIGRFVYISWLIIALFIQLCSLSRIGFVLSLKTLGSFNLVKDSHRHPLLTCK